MDKVITINNLSQTIYNLRKVVSKMEGKDLTEEQEKIKQALEQAAGDCEMAVAFIYHVCDRYEFQESDFGVSEIMAIFAENQKLKRENEELKKNIPASYV
mgnify:FL=1